MNYKIHVSGYIEETQQLLVSFSSDETKLEAKDYQSMAFDIVSYGDVSIEEILRNIARQAPTVCQDIITYESITNNDEKSEEFRNLIGQSFDYEYSDLFDVDISSRANARAPEPVESETL